MGAYPTYPRRSAIPDVRSPFYAGDDPYQMAFNDRQRAVAQGDMLGQEMSDWGNEEDFWRQYYRGRGNDAFNEISEGRGGYREGERNDIIGADRLSAMQLTPEQRQALFLNEQEQSGMLGDPSKAQGWFDPEWYDQLNTEGNQRIGEGVGQSIDDFRNSFDPDALSLSSGYRDELGDILKTGAGGVRGALAGGESGVRGAINYDKLALDPNFAGKYGMSDRDVDDITGAAASDQAQIVNARLSEIKRAAAQQGGQSPLALANVFQNLTMYGDQAGSRARLDAKIAAKAQQAGRLKDIESMRLGAEGRYAGLAGDAELALSGRRADAEMGLYDRSYDAAKGYEGMRLGTEQDKANRRYDIAGAGSNLRMKGIADQNARNTDNARYIGETGVSVYRGTDDRLAERNAAIAAARLNAEKYGQESDFERKRYGDAALSTRTATAADKRREDEKEYRAWLAGQQSVGNENVNANFDRRIKNYGQAGQLAQGSTGDVMQYDLGRRGQSFGTNFKSALGKGLGTTLGNPFEAYNSYKKASGG